MMKNYADRELCQQIYDRKLILDAEMCYANEYRDLEQEPIRVMIDEYKECKDTKAFICPAYNCVELLDALPDEIYFNSIKEYAYPVIMPLNYFEIKYMATYVVDGKNVNERMLSISDFEPCNALAKMILYLDDKGLLKEANK